MHIKSRLHPILVVGGAGYIGSHMVLALQQAGYHVVVLDNLSKGYRDAVLNAELIVGDMGDKQLLTTLFSSRRFSAVMHFASFIEVGESVQFPAKYYQNNVAATLTLLEVMLAHKVDQFIFSSTAAVYGEPHYAPIDEAHPIAPINPYGRSKWMVEEIIKDYAKSDNLRYAILRYFNAAGADPQGRLRERHEPESHLIPLILQVAAGLREVITVNGRDYATEDGTCVRDYVHVSDLCSAHLLALEALSQREENVLCNLGTGQGYSVQQVLDVARLVTGHAIPTVDGPRRPGDPAVLVAEATLAKRVLNWTAVYSDLTTIVKHAWHASQHSKPFVIGAAPN
jgi:UDP-glucose 4-epimerase